MLLELSHPRAAHVCSPHCDRWACGGEKSSPLSGLGPLFDQPQINCCGYRAEALGKAGQSQVKAAQVCPLWASEPARWPRSPPELVPPGAD